MFRLVMIRAVICFALFYYVRIVRGAAAAAAAECQLYCKGKTMLHVFVQRRGPSY